MGTFGHLGHLGHLLNNAGKRNERACPTESLLSEGMPDKESVEDKMSVRVKSMPKSGSVGFFFFESLSQSSLMFNDFKVFFFSRRSLCSKVAASSQADMTSFTLLRSCITCLRGWRRPKQKIDLLPDTDPEIECARSHI